MVSPPPDVGSGAAAAAAATAAAAPPTRDSMSTPERGAAASASVAALDRADIRPLDVAGALQILIAEVRAAFDEIGGASAPLVPFATATVDDEVAAARAIVELVLQSLPESFEPTSWSVALPRADAALQAGVEKAVEVVGAWRDVTPAVVNATRESGAMALHLIAGEPPYPWPPPEWVGLARRLRRLWRRRRALGRRLVDPDHDSHVGHDIGSQWVGLDELD